MKNNASLETLGGTYWQDGLEELSLAPVGEAAFENVNFHVTRSVRPGKIIVRSPRNAEAS